MHASPYLAYAAGEKIRGLLRSLSLPLYTFHSNVCGWLYIRDFANRQLLVDPATFDSFDLQPLLTAGKVSNVDFLVTDKNGNSFFLRKRPVFFKA